MPLILPGNVGSATAATGYNVANSCMFNDGDSAYMHRTPSAGNRRTMTLSVWIKGSSLADGSNNVLGQYNSSNENNAMLLVIEGAGKIMVWNYTTDAYTMDIRTNRLLRDNSSWYHIVVAVDTTQATASNRVKVYVNGVQETSLAVASYPAENLELFLNQGVAQNIGTQRYGSTVGSPFDGYMAEFCFIDGTQNAVTDFGEFDEDSKIWKPIDVSGLTFGTNGYYLDFEDSSALGNDVSGNDNDFTTVNLAATDQSTDTCTNNFCTWNILDSFYSSATFSEGNTTVVTPNASLTYATGTVGLSSGRWYFEVQPFDPSDNNNIGIVDHVSTSNSSSAGELQFQPRGWCYRQVGDVYNNNSSVSGSWAAYSAGVTIGVFVDLEDNKIYWSRNGAMQNSGTGVTITAAASTDTGFYFPAVGDYVTNDDTTFRTNFGGVSSFAISSGVTDDNGYGTFEYTPSVTVDSTAKKFYAICTKNLAEYG